MKPSLVIGRYYLLFLLLMLFVLILGSSLKNDSREGQPTAPTPKMIEPIHQVPSQKSEEQKEKPRRRVRGGRTLVAFSNLNKESCHE